MICSTISMDLYDNDGQDPRTTPVTVRMAEPGGSIAPGIYIEGTDFAVSVIMRDGCVQVIHEVEELPSEAVRLLEVLP